MRCPVGMAGTTVPVTVSGRACKRESDRSSWVVDDKANGRVADGDGARAACRDDTRHSAGILWFDHQIVLPERLAVIPGQILLPLMVECCGCTGKGHCNRR